MHPVELVWEPIAPDLFTADSWVLLLPSFVALQALGRVMTVPLTFLVKVAPDQLGAAVGIEFEANN